MISLSLKLSDKKVPIKIKKGIIASILEEVKHVSNASKIAIITDSNVDALYGDKLRARLDSKFLTKTIIVSPGENSKSIETLNTLYDALLDFEINRGDLIIAFGGGVIGDLVGYTASTLLRGIPYIQIPTTLLAQVDSSIGGKVAVNLIRGKNLIGTFYHPQAVIIDPDFLKTLEPRVLSDGMAEVIKYACIKSEKLFDDLMNFQGETDLFENMDKIIETCVKIKMDLVEKDEYDLGDRMLLNFGHTLGHAIERFFDYQKFTHGEAVAIGMYQITKQSEYMEITKTQSANRIKALLIKYSLPFELPNENDLDTIEDSKELIKTIRYDKKNSGKKFNLIVLNRIGEAVIHSINSDEIDQYFN